MSNLKDYTKSIGILHNVGKRSEQQDSYGISDYSNIELLQDKGLLLIIADGMGGMNYGREVSSLLTQSLIEAFSNRSVDTDPSPWLLEILGDANRCVNSFLHDKLPGGSTLVLVLVKNDNQIYHISVGDSRIYLYRNGGLILLSREQSYGNQLDLMLLKEIMPANIIASHPQRQALVSYVGMGDLEGIDRNTIPLTLIPNDVLLLLTDGVFKTLSNDEIVSEIEKSSDPQAIADNLANEILAKDVQYQDNFTGIIFKY